MKNSQLPYISILTGMLLLPVIEPVWANEAQDTTDDSQLEARSDDYPVSGLENNHVEPLLTQPSEAKSQQTQPQTAEISPDITHPISTLSAPRVLLPIHQLFVTLAYFDITKQNVATPDPINPFLSVATGEQRSHGVEFDLSGEILPGWNMIAAYAYTDAEVSKDNIFPIGNRLPGIPKHNASLWTTYQIQRGALQGLGAGVGFNFVGERQGDLTNSFVLDSYFLTNAAVFYRRNNYRFAVNFKNIFNVDYSPGTPFSNNRIDVGEPFTVIGSVSVEF